MRDRMSDPEIVFRINDDGSWTPIEYTQHPHIYQHSECGVPGVSEFVVQWDRTLRRQGFVEAAVETETSSEKVTA
jgi:hypothetical protein